MRKAHEYPLRIVRLSGPDRAAARLWYARRRGRLRGDWFTRSVRTNCPGVLAGVVSPDPQAERELAAEVAARVGSLPYAYRAGLEMRFGLGDGYCYDYGQIGRVLGVTREAARRMVLNGTDMLRRVVLSRWGE